MSYRYGFIGGGNMATAILAGVLRKGLCKPGEILVSDISGDRLSFLAKEYGIATTTSNGEVVRETEAVVLAIKPQTLGEVAAEIADEFREGQTVVSILAGVRSAALAEKLGPRPRIIRAMPNLPATVGKGVTALSEPKDSHPTSFEEAKKLLSTIGATVTVKEELLDAVTAVSGSGPGYVFRIADLFLKAAVEVGLPQAEADSLVRQTLLGAAAMLAVSEESAEELCKRVCSPGGTTLAGLEAMMAAGLEEALRKGVLAARDRSVELSGG
jgi:pyrroline-5-carboxylate reductase